MRVPSSLLLSLCAGAWLVAATGGVTAQAPKVVLDPVVVTATRSDARAFDLPVSIDRIDMTTLQVGQPMVNLSESLVRIPGLVVLNRQNYAQDLQISLRGFGARSTFGVRGIRLYQDDIPATMPDGQGQTGSFSLLSAQRIEVLRGPFSTLYGNAAGGVIAVFSEDGTPRPEVTLNGGAGSYNSWTAGTKLTGQAGDGRLQAGYVAAVSRFSTEGFRDHAAALRDLVNAKLTLTAGSDTRITLVASTQYQPETQDPLGLARAQWQADPRAVDPAALVFNTRKTVRQEQAGAVLDQQLTPGTSVKVISYGGARQVRQYLAFSGVGATSSGGVTDLDRTFGGVGVRLAWRG
ncbi:MAG: TonB-dependent receptor plug domain-containing protein, partial [Casimicrobiaceae bacterium]